MGKFRDHQKYTSPRKKYTSPRKNFEIKEIYIYIEAKIIYRYNDNREKTMNVLTNSKVYLAVPYAEKNQAKQLGARFDWDVKKWYVMSNHSNTDKLQERWKLNTDPVVLSGEDRKYGGNELFIDLIPRSCWFTNVRSCTHPTDWDRLRNYVYSRANNTCECCNNKTNNIEAHERWNYDIKTKIQKLVRLVALCKKCHTTTHIGFAKIKGNYQEALEHLKQVRKFTHDQALEHEKQAYQVWRERNKIEWTLDLSILTNIKLTQKKPKPR